MIQQKLRATCASQIYEHFSKLAYLYGEEIAVTGYDKNMEICEVSYFELFQWSEDIASQLSFRNYFFNTFFIIKDTP